jgi:phosphoserine phosphatase RsbX
MEGLNEPMLEIGVAGLALPGESKSGDRHVFEPFSGGVLVAVIDGIGHGEEAAKASEAACAILKENPSEPVIVLVERCHENLRSTRGVTMSLASFDAVHNLLTWLGIGNVEGIVRRFGLPIDEIEEALLLRAGVVGDQLPALRASVLPIAPGDTVVLATDGVRSGFSSRIDSTVAPQRAAQEILDGYSKGTDDALVLVARYQGCSAHGNCEHNR